MKRHAFSWWVGAAVFVAVIAVIVVFALGGGEASEEPVEAEAGPPVVLIFHGGGFTIGDPDSLDEAVTVAAESGLEPVVVEYPLNDLAAAYAAARRSAQFHSEAGGLVYAYGESAGGTLAALLAQEGEVAAAATYAQLTSMVEFTENTNDPAFYKALIGASDEDLRMYSPAFRETTNQILALTPTGDEPRRNRVTQEWDQREERVYTVSVPGGHLGSDDDPSIYRNNARLAMGWLAGLDAPP